jgi:hypothetical protein
VSLTFAFARTGAAVEGGVLEAPDALDDWVAGEVAFEPMDGAAAGPDSVGLAVVTLPTDAVARGDATTRSDSDASSRPQAASSTVITKDMAISRCRDMGTTVAASACLCT